MFAQAMTIMTRELPPESPPESVPLPPLEILSATRPKVALPLASPLTGSAPAPLRSGFRCSQTLVPITFSRGWLVASYSMMYHSVPPTDS